MELFALKKVLPIINPPITGFQAHAFLLAAILNNPKNYLWLYNNYIQLIVRLFDNTEVVDFFTKSMWDYSPNPFFYKKMIYGHIEHLDELIITSIEQGYYIYMSVNEFYIPNRNSFNQRNYTHDLLIYGYDNESEIFYTMGFDDKNTLSENTIKQCQVVQAYNSIDGHFNHFISLFKSTENSQIQLDVQGVVYQLSDYLYTQNMKSMIQNFIMHPGSSYNTGPQIEVSYSDYCGISVYSFIMGYIEQLMKKEVNYDIRHLHILWEHKKCMGMRIEYLLNNHYLFKDGIELHEQYKLFEKEALTCRNLMLKFGVANENKLLEKVIEKLKVMADEEHTAIMKLLGFISI